MVRLVKTHREFKLVGEELVRIDPSQQLTVGGINELYSAMAPLFKNTKKHMKYSIVFNGVFFLGGPQAQSLHDFLFQDINLAGYWVKQGGSALILKSKEGHLLFFDFPNCMKSKFFVPPNATTGFFLIEPLGFGMFLANVVLDQGKEAADEEEEEEDKDAVRLEEQSEEQSEWQSEMMSPVKAKPNLTKGPEVPLNVAVEESEEDEEIEVLEETSINAEAVDEDSQENSTDLRDTPELEPPSTTSDKEDAVQEETVDVVEPGDEEAVAVDANAVAVAENESNNDEDAAKVSLKADLSRKYPKNQDAALRADLLRILAGTKEHNVESAGSAYMRNARRQRAGARGRSSSLATVALLEEKESEDDATVALLEEKESEDDGPPPVFVGANGSQSF